LSPPTARLKKRQNTRVKIVLKPHRMVFIVFTKKAVTGRANAGNDRSTKKRGKKGAKK
jgi:hypothetical protein